MIVSCVACSGGGSDGAHPPIASASAPPIVAPPAAPPRERWSATIVFPTENRDVLVSFEKYDPAAPWSATLDVPVAKLTGAALSRVALEPERIAFTLEKKSLPEQAWEVYELKRAKDGDEASGTLTVSGQTFAVRMVRLKDGEAPRTAFKRPQTPEAPYPYPTREVTVDAPDGAKLAGTLTVPSGSGPFPAVLLWSGSGQEDRDETVFGHKPWLILADALARAGIAALRLDDRGVGKTTGNVGSLDTEIADASAAVEFMKAQPELDAKRLGMVGHSTGGMVLPNVAVKTKSLAFLVSLAGVALPGSELVPLQLEIDGKLRHAPEADLKEAIAAQKKVGAAVAKGDAAVKAVFVELFTPAMKAELGRAPTAAEVDAVVAPKVAEVMAPWPKSYFTLDPRVAWKKVSAPVLLVVGEKDTQVPADPTIQALKSSLSKPSLLTALKLPGLNHLFQHAETGLSEEYAAIDESFDPETLETITTWLKTQAKVP
ncbi:MAG: alpha/beta fold hydrolase [Polyangiaceae bacterium]